MWWWNDIRGARSTVERSPWVPYTVYPTRTETMYTQVRIEDRGSSEGSEGSVSFSFSLLFSSDLNRNERLFGRSFVIDQSLKLFLHSRLGPNVVGPNPLSDLSNTVTTPHHHVTPTVVVRPGLHHSCLGPSSPRGPTPVRLHNPTGELLPFSVPVKDSDRRSTKAHS